MDELIGGTLNFLQIKFVQCNIDFFWINFIIQLIVLY